MSVAPPRPKGPHLNALRAFEAAARLGGFSAAAEELSVTPGAVSQHIKTLEGWANAPLFERRSQGVVLTQLGNQVAEELRAAFDVIGSAQRKLRTNTAQRAINIAAMPSVAQLWLSPRMPAIREDLPRNSISITAMEKAPNLRREMFDMSLFIDRPTGSRSEVVLAEDVIFPVCTPAIAERLTSPDHLASEPLLFDALWKSDWSCWLEGIGRRPDSIGEDGPTYSLYSLALEEARNGAGVLIGHEMLVAPLLRSGALVAPFAERVSTGKALILEAATPQSASAKRVIERLTRAD